MSDVSPVRFVLHDRFIEQMRLQFLSTGNWKTAIDDAGLPDHVSDLIRDVVQQTGLLRFEKSEIATELIHHFQDGHERGRTYEELVRDFGTTDVAVSLFRSSKLRSRPMSVKAFRGSAIVFGGSLVTYLILQLFFHSAKPNPTVDYSAKLNEAAASMPVEQQAWPLYRDLWAKYGLGEGGSEKFKEIFVASEDRRLIRPEDEGWEKAVAKLESVAELTQAFREGSKRPFLGTPLHSDRSKYSEQDLKALFPNLTREQIISMKNKEKSGFTESMGLVEGVVSSEADKLMAESTVNILLPHVQEFREIAKIFHVDTRLAVQQGDQSRALDNITTIFGLGQQVGDSPIVVCSLVGLAIRGIGFSLIEEMLLEHPDFFTDDQLKDLQNYLGNIDFEIALDTSFEPDMIKDLIQRIYSDDGNGDGRMTAVGTEVLLIMRGMSGPNQEMDTGPFETPLMRSVLGPVNLFTFPTRKEMTALTEDLYEKFGDELQTSMWEQTDFDMQEYLRDKDPSGFLAGIGMMTEQIKSAREIKIARRDAVVLAIACHRYKRANDAWPTTLDDLMGRWLNSTPLDRLSGKALSFTITDDQPVIYSLGHDGDDDGGKVLQLSNAPWLDKDSDGDWVLWPTVED